MIRRLPRVFWIVYLTVVCLWGLAYGADLVVTDNGTGAFWPMLAGAFAGMVLFHEVAW